jgi:hypothetical protein
MSGDGNIEDLFEDGGPFEDPLAQQAALMAKAPPQPAKGYITCPLAWLQRVLPLVRSADQLVVLMLLYRRCLMAKSQTVTLPNGDLAALGISRYTKYRLLGWLRGTGAATVEGQKGASAQGHLALVPIGGPVRLPHTHLFG